MGREFNAETLRRRRKAKRKGERRHEFHEGARIWQNVGVNWTAAGRRLYGNSTKLWTDSFMRASGVEKWSVKIRSWSGRYDDDAA